MKVKCDYCGSFIEDTDETCPHCGGVNEHVMRSADGVPKTIEELKALCRAKNLPLEKMRFYIGMDFRQPKAFGIYKDSDGNFVVYKNKGDGTRAERYRGKDEAYAVNEIYQKLRSEIQIRREKNSAPPQKSAPKAGSSGKRINSRRAGIAFVVGFILLVVILALIPAGEDRPGNGYAAIWRGFTPAIPTSRGTGTNTYACRTGDSGSSATPPSRICPNCPATTGLPRTVSYTFQKGASAAGALL